MRKLFRPVVTLSPLTPTLDLNHDSIAFQKVVFNNGKSQLINGKTSVSIEL